MFCCWKEAIKEGSLEHKMINMIKTQTTKTQKKGKEEMETPTLLIYYL